MNQAKLRVDDEWFTPRSAWESISDFIPRDATVWEPFRGNGSSTEFLTDLGFTVVSEDEDFFLAEPKGSIVVSNPPFSKSKQVLRRLVEIGMPFILILPTQKLTTQHFRELFASTQEHLKLIVPRKRINFVKPGLARSKCTFDTFFYCWRVPTMASSPQLNFL